MRFEKWQAAGNAYLVIERGDLSAALTPPRVQRICHADLGAAAYSLTHHAANGRFLDRPSSLSL